MLRISSRLIAQRLVRRARIRHAQHSSFLLQAGWYLEDDALSIKEPREVGHQRLVNVRFGVHSRLSQNRACPKLHKNERFAGSALRAEPEAPMSDEVSGSRDKPGVLS